MAIGIQRNGWIYSIGASILLNKSFSYQVKPTIVTFSLKNNHSLYLYLSHSNAIETSETQLKNGGKVQNISQLNNSFVINQEFAIQ